jgi:hypothetical protein
MLPKGSALCHPVPWWRQRNARNSSGGLMGQVNEERRLGVVQGGGLLAIDTIEEPHAYIPCTVCRAPIPIDNAHEPLPRRLTCPACGTALER